MAGDEWRDSVDDRFLRMLDPNSSAAIQKYQTLREKLIWYFEQWNTHDPADAADETIKRALEKIRTNAADITVPLAAYCYGIAYYVRLESHNAHSRDEADPDSSERMAAQPTGPSDIELRASLSIALQRLGEPGAGLLLEYAAGNRREMASRLALTENALRIRVQRERVKLRRIMGYSEPAKGLKGNVAASGAME